MLMVAMHLTFNSQCRDQAVDVFISQSKVQHRNHYVTMCTTNLRFVHYRAMAFIALKMVLGNSVLHDTTMLSYLNLGNKVSWYSMQFCRTTVRYGANPFTKVQGFNKREIFLSWFDCVLLSSEIERSNSILVWLSSIIKLNQTQWFD